MYHFPIYKIIRVVCWPNMWPTTFFVLMQEIHTFNSFSQVLCFSQPYAYWFNA